MPSCKKKNLKKQYINEKSLIEGFDYYSAVTFEECLEIKNKQV
jgi:hypothetical protein